MNTDTTPVTLEELMGPEVDSAPWVQQSQDWNADRRARRAAAEDRAADEATRATLNAVLTELLKARSVAHETMRHAEETPTGRAATPRAASYARGKYEGLTEAVTEVRAALAHLTA